jgi:hypothetical protein
MAGSTPEIQTPLTTLLEELVAAGFGYDYAIPSKDLRTLILRSGGNSRPLAIQVMGGKLVVGDRENGRFRRWNQKKLRQEARPQ